MAGGGLGVRAGAPAAPALTIRGEAGASASGGSEDAGAVVARRPGGRGGRDDGRRGEARPGRAGGRGGDVVRRRKQLDGQNDADAAHREARRDRADERSACRLRNRGGRDERRRRHRGGGHRRGRIGRCSGRAQRGRDGRLRQLGGASVLVTRGGPPPQADAGGERQRVGDLRRVREAPGRLALERAREPGVEGGGKPGQRHRRHGHRRRAYLHREDRPRSRPRRAARPSRICTR